MNGVKQRQTMRETTPSYSVQESKIRAEQAGMQSFQQASTMEQQQFATISKQQSQIKSFTKLDSLQQSQQSFPKLGENPFGKLPQQQQLKKTISSQQVQQQTLNPLFFSENALPNGITGQRMSQQPENDDLRENKDRYGFLNTAGKQKSGNTQMLSTSTTNLFRQQQTANKSMRATKNNYLVSSSGMSEAAINNSQNIIRISNLKIGIVGNGVSSNGTTSGNIPNLMSTAPNWMSSPSQIQLTLRYKKNLRSFSKTGSDKSKMSQTMLIQQQQILPAKVVMIPEPLNTEEDEQKQNHRMSIKVRTSMPQFHLDQDFERGVNLQNKNELILKLKQENLDQKIVIRKLEMEIEKLLPNEENENGFNDKCKICGQSRQMANQLEREMNKLNVALKEKNSNEQKILDQNRRDEQTISQFGEELRELREKFDEILQENLILKHQQGQSEEINEKNKLFLESQAKKQAEQRQKVEGQVRDQKKAHEELNEKVKLLKNSEIWIEAKKVSKNEFSVVKTEIMDNMENLNWERLLVINQNSTLITKLNKDYEDIKKVNETLTAELEVLNQDVSWMKKQQNLISKSSKSFNYFGLVEEILAIKKIIESTPKQELKNSNSVEGESENILIIPPDQLQQAVLTLEQSNQEFNTLICKISMQEQKLKSTIESIPILKHFDQSEEKVEIHLKCSKCSQILTEAITCVPCGHNFCKTCHYERCKGLPEEEAQELSVSCIKCGPATMIYRNETLDELIDMFNTMKSAKEVMKAYLKEQ